MKTPFAKSTSSSQNIPLRLKMGEWIKQLVGLLLYRAPWSKSDYSWLERDLFNYQEAARQYGKFELSDATLFEIGCVQRPYRFFFLIANGLNVTAVDLDKVSMSFSPADFIRILSVNGFERFLKTFFRNILFDRTDNRKFRSYLSMVAGGNFVWPMNLIRQGSAVDPGLWPGTEVDFVYSEDVFEHIPAEMLPAICRQMRSRMSPRGIAWIKPLIFTGIQGGHAFDWYSLNEERRRTCPPWDHLRSQRFPANTFLNKLTRNDYRILFSESFEILEERDVKPDLGRHFMTPEIRSELEEYSEEDLYSNGVVFILRPKNK